VDILRTYLEGMERVSEGGGTKDRLDFHCRMYKVHKEGLLYVHLACPTIPESRVIQ
jgi:hypothetical protein